MWLVIRVDQTAGEFSQGGEKSKDTALHKAPRILVDQVDFCSKRTLFTIPQMAAVLFQVRFSWVFPIYCEAWIYKWLHT